MIEADFVHQIGGPALVVGDLGERQAICLERAVARDCRIDRDAWAHRILVVDIGVHVLRRIPDQPLGKLERVGLVGRVTGEHHTRQVHMRAAFLEGRQDDPCRLRPGLAIGFLVENQRPVVGVGDSEIALAGRDVARGLAIAAGGFLRQLGLEPAQPLLGRGFA